MPAARSGLAQSLPPSCRSGLGWAALSKQNAGHRRRGRSDTASAPLPAATPSAGLAAWLPLSSAGGGRAGPGDAQPSPRLAPPGGSCVCCGSRSCASFRGAIQTVPAKPPSQRGDSLRTWSATAAPGPDGSVPRLKAPGKLSCPQADSGGIATCSCGSVSPCGTSLCRVSHSQGHCEGHLPAHTSPKTPAI